MAMDWQVRVFTATWLELANLGEAAQSLRSLPPLDSWDAVVKKNGAEIGKIVDTANEIRPAAKIDDLMDTLKAEALNFSTGAEIPRRFAMLDDLEKNLRPALVAAAEKRGTPDYVSFKDLHENVQGYQKIAHEARKSRDKPTAREDVAETIADALRKKLQSSLEETAARGPSAMGADALPRLKALNRQYEGQKLVQKIMHEKLKNTSAETAPLREAIEKMGKHGIFSKVKHAAVSAGDRALTAADPYIVKLQKIVGEGGPHAADAAKVLRVLTRGGAVAAPNAPMNVGHAVVNAAETLGDLAGDDTVPSALPTPLVPLDEKPQDKPRDKEPATTATDPVEEDEHGNLKL